MLTLINGKQGQLATRDPGCGATVLFHQTRNTLEALFPQDETMDNSASFTLSNLDSVTHITPYTICDAASCNDDVANVL